MSLRAIKNFVSLSPPTKEPEVEITIQITTKKKSRTKSIFFRTQLSIIYNIKTMNLQSFSQAELQVANINN